MEPHKHLMAAVNNSDSEAVARMLGDGVEETQVDQALRLAVEHNNLPMVQLLLPHAAGSSLNRNIRRAAIHGNTEMVQLFVPAVSADALAEALEVAVEAAQPPVVRQLLPHIQKTQERYLLKRAAERGHKAVLKALMGVCARDNRAANAVMEQLAWERATHPARFECFEMLYEKCNQQVVLARLKNAYPNEPGKWEAFEHFANQVQQKKLAQVVEDKGGARRERKL